MIIQNPLMKESCGMSAFSGFLCAIHASTTLLAMKFPAPSQISSELIEIIGHHAEHSGQR